MSNVYQVGSVIVTQGSPIVKGVGTSWLTYVSPGSTFEVEGFTHVVYQVIDVATIELTNPYLGETASQVPYQITPP